MFDEYLKREDVNNLIDNIKYNPKYYNKDNKIDYYNIDNNIYGIFILYESLYKYKIIINDNLYLNNYIEQLNLLFKKIDNYNDLLLGINKIIKSLVIKILKIEDVDNNKNIIIKYIYDKYIINGYYIYGFNSHYLNEIINNGLVIDNINNYNDEYLTIINIFKKYNVDNILDYESNNILLSDSISISCINSLISDRYLCNLISGYMLEYINLDSKCFYEKDIDGCLDNLEKIYSYLDFNDNDKEIINNTFIRLFNLYIKNSKDISLLFIKRNKINNKLIDINKILDRPLDEIIDNILISKSSNILWNNNLNVIDYDIINIVSDYSKKTEVKKEEQKDINLELANAYGKVSILLIIGSLLISIGVIIILILIIGGMI